MAQDLGKFLKKVSKKKWNVKKPPRYNIEWSKKQSQVDLQPGSFGLFLPFWVQSDGHSTNR